MVKLTEHADETLPDWPEMIDWRWMMALAVMLILGGVLAFLNPFLASLTVEAIAGATFLAAGAWQLWVVMTGRDGGNRLLGGALGLALVVLAVALLANPLAGLVSLTFAVGVLFALMGALRMLIAWDVRPRGGWGWMMASGVVSVALAVLIFVSLPQSALALLGLFLAVDLVTSGLVALAMALRARRRQ
ncbi:DUF308 domain-containing protein [Lutimaribacter sp. EGI FJ00015]|uniref:DUF308 domain-containing protein n=1 Tax=Lutimaribacter degradans TaxID=2945989 RepID=A0ACC5ZXT4_9RHOB|nr:DUF308 domain-containing protein [Lutimaribacter sp. EGI FJ00013]MCM2563117.1 DUF308 domain-containing protein [Lutimaribacter sp. EGI FJ00013]MCO0614296.1 DUF308 domain-containing protein [Lutimaribacter sp. EGI FJ00015]MCO0637106.1 DUF308 domain-containing protein [Lutimaribacter sp. EGI FJ00014]